MGTTLMELLANRAFLPELHDLDLMITNELRDKMIMQKLSVYLEAATEP